MSRKHLPYIGYLFVAAMTAIQFYQEDWELVLFGLAAVGVILWLLFGLLIFEIKLVNAIFDCLNFFGTSRPILVVITQFCLFGATAAAHGTLLFGQCFDLLYLPFDNAGQLLMKLLFVTSVLCLPWIDSIAAEAKVQDPIPSQDLILLNLLIGCALVIGASILTGTPPSWLLLACAFAAPLPGALVIYMARRMPEALLSPELRGTTTTFVLRIGLATSIIAVTGAALATEQGQPQPADLLLHRQAKRVCFGQATDEQRIAACTTVISAKVTKTDELITAHYRRAGARLDRREYDRVLDDTNQVIRLKPEHAGAHNRRGLAYKNKEQYVEAVRDYNTSIRLNPDNPEPYYNRANVFRYTGLYDEALRDYSRAIDRDPEFIEAVVNRGITYRITEQFDRALEDCTRAMAINPNYELAYFNRATTYHRLKRFQDALNDYDTAVKISPRSAISLFGRGVAKRGLGDVAGSNADIAAATAIDNKIADGMAEIGVLP